MRSSIRFLMVYGLSSIGSLLLIIGHSRIDSFTKVISRSNRMPVIISDIVRYSTVPMLCFIGISLWGLALLTDFTNVECALGIFQREKNRIFPIQVLIFSGLISIFFVILPFFALLYYKYDACEKDNLRFIDGLVGVNLYSLSLFFCVWIYLLFRKNELLGNPGTGGNP